MADERSEPETHEEIHFKSYKKSFARIASPAHDKTFYNGVIFRPQNTHPKMYRSGRVGDV